MYILLHTWSDDGWEVSLVNFAAPQTSKDEHNTFFYGMSLVLHRPTEKLVVNNDAEEENNKAGKENGNHTEPQEEIHETQSLRDDENDGNVNGQALPDVHTGAMDQEQEEQSQLQREDCNNKQPQPINVKWSDVKRKKWWHYWFGTSEHREYHSRNAMRTWKALPGYTIDIIIVKQYFYQQWEQ